MMLNPFFSDFDDGYYSHNPYSHREQQRRRALAEHEARRRAEQERYYRMKEWEEQERLRRQQEYARRLRQQQKMEEQEACEEELRRRRVAQQEEEAERSERLRALRFLRGEYDPGDEEHDSKYESDDDSDDEVQEEPVYRLVRGPDNRIYRIPVATNRKLKATRRTMHRPAGAENKENIQHSPKIPVVTKKDRSRTMPAMANTTSMEVELPEPAEKIETSDLPLGSSKFMSSKKNRGKTKKNKGKKTRVTIIVEDASDSEAENEYASAWRNRRPSPGEWMEPVESFDSMRH